MGNDATTWVGVALTLLNVIQVVALAYIAARWSAAKNGSNNGKARGGPGESNGV